MHFHAGAWERYKLQLRESGSWSFHDCIPKLELGNERKMYTHLAYCQVYDKMRMACKRQKLREKVNEYQDLADRHKLVFDELKRVADIAWDAKMDAIKQRRE